MASPKLWFSYTSTEYPYKEEEYGFYPNEDFEWVKLLEDNFEVLQQEAKEFVNQTELDPYFNKSMVNVQGGWKTKGLLFWGRFHRKNYEAFKNTWEIIKNIKGICAFSVSTLTAGTVIKPHRGDTNAIIRVHLPIVVPGDISACSFTVIGEKRAWEIGKAILFNDAQQHEAQNLSKGTRIVLILDVIRPEFINQRYSIQAKVLNGLSWQWITQSYPAIKNYPLIFKQILWFSVRSYFHLIGRINKWFIWP